MIMIGKEYGMTQGSDLSAMRVSADPAVVPLWDRVILGILSHAAATGPDLAAVIERDPDFALAQAIRGVSCLLLARTEMVATAREALAEAEAAARRRPPTEREAGFIAALGLWLDGSPTAAAARIQQIMDQHPRDALAMKMVHAIHFVMGRPAAMRRSIEGVLPDWDDHPARGYLLGCHAFSLEETGDYARAERVGMLGVELAPQDAWGLHAVAHVHDMTGRAREGLAWLDGREASWAHCNNFRFHVWWHRALMYLDLGDYDAALDLYDREVRSEHTDDYRDISNGASMLARLEIEGVDVGRRWDELADLSERRSDDGVLAFADLHYLLSLIGGNRDQAAAHLVSQMAAIRAAEGENRAIIHQPGHRVALGLQAFGDGDYAHAWLHLRSGLAELQKVGGSHAQRDVFSRLAVESALRGGYLDAAERLLHERTTLRGGHEDGYTDRRMDILQAARARAAG